MRGSDIGERRPVGLHMRAVALLAAVTISGVAATEVAAADPCKLVAAGTSAEFAAPGPYAVGVSTFTFVDTSRPTAPNGEFPGAPERTLVTEVWYPAQVEGRDTPVDSSGGPYPVVVHSHGFLDRRDGEAYVGQHLASHGYVVASTDYPLSNGSAPGGATVADIHNQPGDASFVLDQVVTLFGADVDGERIGASGLSLGGLTTHLLAYHATLRDARIDAAVMMAAPGCIFSGRFFKTAAVSRLILHGDSDLIVPYKKNGKRAFRGGQARRHLVELEVGSHTGFSAFAPLFDPDVHYDVLGCAAIDFGLGDVGDDGSNPFESLGGKEYGIKTNSNACPSLCVDPLPSGPSMLADRHHELTKISTLAFFEAYLRDDVIANCFVGKPMALENADVTAKAKGKF